MVNKMAVLNSEPTVTPMGRKKSSVKKLIRRMDPIVRDAFLKEESEANMDAHIRPKENGKFCVDLYLNTHKDGNYDAANADKEFDSYKEAAEFVGKFFEANPEMNEDLESDEY